VGYNYPPLCGIISNNLWLLDTNVCFAYRIIRLALQTSQSLFYHGAARLVLFPIAKGYWIVPLALRASFHSLSASVTTTYASNFIAFVFSLSHYQRVLNPASLRSWDNSTCASNFAKLVFSESHYLYWNVARKRIMAPMNNTVPMAAIARSCGQTTLIPASLMSTREQNSI